MRPAIPLFLYGVRFWLSVCLALFVAFRLELQNPFWAGTTAGIVCQPVLGASLRKGWFRMIGTVIGAAAIVALTAAFPQSRAGFLIALALWGGLCGFAATLLRNFASYAAALAGYTAVIIAGDELGAVGGLNGQAFDLAVTRASEICIGIVSAGIVLAGTDRGQARRRLALLFAGLSAQITAGLVHAFQLPGPRQGESRLHRRELIQQVSPLDTVIDQARGETTALRFHPRTLQEAVDGLFAALSAWRTIALHLEHMAEASADQTAILETLPETFRNVPAQPSPADVGLWTTDAPALRASCLASARALLAFPAGTPSARLLADRAAEGLLGIYRALGAVLVLLDPTRLEPRRDFPRLRVPDILPALINAVRVVLTIGIAECVWVGTGWPGGATAIMFAAITVILFSPREYAAFAAIQGFTIGTCLSAVLAALIGFGLLPFARGFPEFCLAMGLVLVPAAALSAQGWQTGLFVALATNFTPLLGPSNPMTYDVASFYNSSLAILGGVVMGAVMMGIVPFLSPEIRARRLLALTLRDMRRLAGGSLVMPVRAWEAHVYGRLSAMPAQADLLQGARLVATLSVGAEMIRLRRLAGRLGQSGELRAAFAAIADGNGPDAILHLDRFDRLLAELPVEARGERLRQRTRGAVTAIAEALQQHAAYFDARDFR